MGDFWVFGYGSLMWNPGFAYETRQEAQVFGYRRSLCVRSWVHRGTQERPGLVLGLDRGGSCKGVAFSIADDQVSAVIDYLRARELVTHVYLERSLSVQLADGRRVKALGYVIDRSHVQYAGAMEIGEAADIVVGAKGVSGANEDYVLNTLEHLRQIKIHDSWLEGVADQIRERHQPSP